jgi:hypothetical protein
MFLGRIKMNQLFRYQIIINQHIFIMTRLFKIQPQKAYIRYVLFQSCFFNLKTIVFNIF